MQNMEETFSSSQDMAKDVGNLKGEKLLGEQDSFVETWTVIGDVNNYWRK